MKFKKENYVLQSCRNGKWSFRVRIPDKNFDKSFTEIKYGSPRRAYDEAIICRNQVLLSNSIIHKNSQIKLSDVFNETFDVLPVREETKRKHLYAFKNHFEDKKFENVTRGDIVLSLNSMIKEKSDDAIERVLSIWRRIYKTAIIKEYTDIDLTAGIIAPKSQAIKKERRPVITDRSTLDLLEEYIINHFNELEAHSVCMALETMWYLGLRPAECFALSPKDLHDGYLDVNKELGTDMATSDESLGREIIVRKCKTEASIRTLPIPYKLGKLFETYRVKGNILFPNQYGGYFDVASLGQRFRKSKIKFNMYQLRHTLATNLVVNSGADSRTIQEILGHESFDMSIYYARSNEEKKKLVLDAI